MKRAIIFSILVTIVVLIVFGGCAHFKKQFPQKWASFYVETDVPAYIYVDAGFPGEVWVGETLVPNKHSGNIYVGDTSGGPMLFYFEVIKQYQKSPAMPVSCITAKWGEGFEKQICPGIVLDRSVETFVIFAPKEVREVRATNKPSSNSGEVYSAGPSSSELERRRVEAEERKADAAEDEAKTSKLNSLMNTLDLYKKHGIIK